jgi:hypothetical protein
MLPSPRRALIRHGAIRVRTALEEHNMYNEQGKPSRKGSRKGKERVRKHAWDAGDREWQQKRRGRDGERWQDAWRDAVRIP